MNTCLKIDPNRLKLSSVIIIILFALLFYPKINFGQTPPLGAASSFAIFTKTGVISNIGPTNITGDLGTDAGAVTGFPPGNIVGQVNITNSISSQAAIDVDAAYNYLIGVTCGLVIGTAMGTNQTLTPNVYCLGAASTITGDLILDGLGDPNAIFIIKINGALTTSVFSNVILTNSANVCNVYWQVNGLFSLGDHSNFKGTVIADGAINLLDSSSLDGRGLSRAGAISLSNNTITLNCPEVILPIELLSFTSKCTDQNAVLIWSTATESNSEYFIIERSKDAMDWENIGKVKSAGNSFTLKNYSYTDHETLAQTSYYRLKQVDLDGKFKHTYIIAFENCQNNLTQLEIYPNPGNGLIKLSFEGDKEAFISASVYNSFGEKVFHSNRYQSEIDLSDKSDGIYFLHFNLTTDVIIKKLAIE
jgi:hypothetical protein